ncbi:MAG: helix-turn-helix transcriptional regulator [Slackia isoflavoniconvertens]|nr:helix-turn-helix transcriptional regulator [Slackia isoflavoniconvertens]
MLVLSNADASAIQAGSLVVIFVYFMVALFLGRGSTEAFVQIEKESTARETDSRVSALEETATLIGMENDTCGRNENEANQEHLDHTHAELRQKPFAPIKAQTSTTSHMEFDAICDSETERALEVIAQARQLTPREIEVFRLLSLGRDIATIENDLCISRNTAKMHIRHVYQKLEVHSKQELIDLVRAQ